MLSLPDIGTFTDAGFGASETFTYEVDWGDGTSADSGTATVDTPGGPGAPTAGSFDGSHTYADSGVYTVTVTVTDDDGGADTDTFQVTVGNVGPSLIVAADQTVDEGTLLSLPDIGTFTDAGFGAGETFTYEIDWGDGTSADTGSATIDTPGGPGTPTAGSFDGAHVYSAEGVYTVTVTVTDDDGGADVETFQVEVVDAIGASVDEGSTYTLNLDDGGLGATEWTIDWGDGTAVQVISGNPSSVDHVYADGPSNSLIEAVATDGTNTYSPDLVLVEVLNVAPTLTIDGDSSVDEGSIYVLQLTSSDPGDDTISSWEIDWGDGNVQTVSGNPSTVEHVYADGDNEHAIAASATDEDGVYAAQGGPLVWGLDSSFSGDGRLATTFFYEGAELSARAHDVAIQSDGKIVVVGEALSDDSSSAVWSFAVVRYLPSGELDPTFGTGGRVTTEFETASLGWGLEIQPDGRIVVAGWAVPESDGAAADYAIARYNPDGSLDTTFGADGKVITDFGYRQDLLYDLALQPDGKIVVAGTSRDGADCWALVARYNSDGNLDATFGADGKTLFRVDPDPTIECFCYAMVIQPDGKIVIGGTQDSYAYLARLDSQAVLDASFGTGGIVATTFGTDLSSHVGGMVVQADGKILVAGSAFGMGHVVARFLADGTLDPSFDAGWDVMGDSGRIAEMLLQSDGRIVLVGRSDTWPETHFQVRRLLVDGSVDSTFGTDGRLTTEFGGAFDEAYAVAADASGRLVVAGVTDAAPNGCAIALARYGMAPGGLTVTVNNVAPALTVVEDQTVLSTELLVLADIGTFTDPGFGAEETFTYQIDWGDGTPVDTGTPTIDVAGHAGPDGAPPAELTQGSFDGSHDYAQGGTYTVSVTVTDDDGGADVKTFEVRVIGVVLASVDEGATYTLSLDPGALAATGWTIDWGDGSPVEEIVGNPSSVDHVYADGPSNHRIDAWASDGVDTFHAHVVFVDVLNVAPTLNAAPDQRILQGGELSLVDLVTFTDPGFGSGETFTYEIDWGDGSAVDTGTATIDVEGHAGPPAVLTEGSFDAAHSYPSYPLPGTYEASITVTDDDGGSDTTTFGVEVFAASQASVDEGTAYTLNLDPGELVATEWTIDWGDGSPVEVISGNPSSAGHVYADGPSIHQIDAWASDGTTTEYAHAAVVSVLNVDPIFDVSGNPSTYEGSAYRLYLSATDPGDDTISSWEIDWGDGPVETLSGNPPWVDHYYADGPQNYLVTATATDEDGTYSAASALDGWRLDPSFHGDGKVVDPLCTTVTNVAIQPDGKIVSLLLPRIQVVRHLPDGSLDPTFGVFGEATATFGDLDDFSWNALEMLPDGKILVAGTATITVDGSPDTQSLLVRFNADGSLDTTFGAGGKVTTNVNDQGEGLADVAIQPDGKIVAVGNASQDGSNAVVMVARYLPDGALDTPFGVGGRRTFSYAGYAAPDVYDLGRRVAIQPDGRIVVVGHTYIDLDPGFERDFGIARLDAQGDLDLTFGNGGVLTTDLGTAQEAVEDVAIQPDGKIVAVGNTGAELVVLRYETDGSVDSSFGVGGMATADNAGGSSVQLQPDGKILVGGFVDDGPDCDVLLTRFLTNGGLDTSFGVDGEIRVDFDAAYSHELAFDIALDGSGRIVVGGACLGPEEHGAFLLRVADLPPDCPVTVHNVAPTLTVGSDHVINEGDTLSLTDIGTFTDPGFDNPLGDPATQETFSYTINWGDGSSPDTGQPTIDTVGGPGVLTAGSFDGSHTYADNGVYTVIVTVTDDDGFDTKMFLVTVENVNPTLTGPGDQVWFEEELLSLPDLGTFTDPGFGPTETFIYEINWGDGTSVDDGDATIDTPGGPGVLTAGSFDGSHVYAEDGVYMVSVTVTDDDDGFATHMFQVTAQPVEGPVLTVVGDQSLDEGATLDLPDVGAFVVPGSDTLVGIPPSYGSYTYTIDWDDGGSPEVGTATIDTGGPGVLITGSFDGNHVYADNGVYTVSVAVADDGGRSDTKTFEVTVANVSPMLVVVGNQTVDEGATLSLPDIGTFTDPGFGPTETFVYEIDWDDGTIDDGDATIDTAGGPGAPTAGSFDGSHIYAHEGTYSVTVKITDDDEGEDTETFQVTVSNVAPTLTVVDDQTVSEGALLDLPNVGTFTDPGFPETFTYSIDWGDGSVPADSGDATIDTPGSRGVPTAGSFDGSHVYADDGLYTVTVTVADDDGGSHVQTFLVAVENVSPTLTVVGNQTIVEGEALTVAQIGTFTDPGFHNPLNPIGATVETFTYTIDWGDGRPTDLGNATIDTAGSIGIPSAGFFDATHDYPGVGNYTYTVTVRVWDDDGGSDYKSFTVFVAPRPNVPPEFDFTPIDVAYVDTAFTDLATAHDDDEDYPLVFSGTIDPADDDFAVSADGQITWTPSAALVGQTFDVVLTVEDQRGATATLPYTISVYSGPNHDPVITSTPPVRFVTADPTAGEPQGEVDPLLLELALALGQAETQTVSVTIPEDQRDFFADVVLLVDTSGSMEGEVDWIGDLSSGMPEGMIMDLNAALEADGIFDNRFAVVPFLNYTRFLGRHEESYTVTVFGPNGDIVSKTVYSDDDFGTVYVPVQMSQIHLADFQLPSDGEYTVVVDMEPHTPEGDPYGGPGLPGPTTEYDFRLRPIVDATDQSELLANTKVKGFVNGLGDRDTYTFQVSEEGYYYFDSLTRRTDLHWTLQRADGTTVEAGSFKPSQDGVADALVRLEPGDHVLTIQADPLSKGAYEFQFLSLASAAAALPIGVKTAGMLRPSAEANVYRFAANAGQRLSFVDGPAGTFDHSLVRWRLVDRWGNTVFEDDLTQSQHDMVMRAGGEYYLLVEGDVSDVQVRLPYEITVLDEGQESLVDVEGLPQVVFNDVTPQGTLDHDESVSYGFHLDGDQLLYFDAATETYDLAWTLEGPGGTLIDAVPLDQATGSAIQMLPAGDYRLTISSLVSEDDVPYQFAVHRLPEGGETLPVSGVTLPESRSGLYQFDGEAGDRLHVDVQNWNSESGQWRVVSPWGQVLKTGSMIDYGFPDEDGSEWVVELPSTGTWSLMVEGDYMTGAQTFDLALHPIVDGNDVVPVDGGVAASIDSPTEVDSHSFTVTTPTLVHVDSWTDDDDLVWSLVDGAGTLVADRPLAQTDAGSLPVSEASVFALPVGEYSIEVHGLAAATGDYALRLVDLSTGDLLPLGGAGLSDSLDAGSHTNFYRFEALEQGTGFQVGDQLQFQLIDWNGETSARWRLVDQFGRELFDEPTGTPTVEVVLPYAGDYFLLVEGAVDDASTPTYTLQVNHQGNQAFTSTALAIQFNELKTGEITSTTQVDGYAFTLTDRTQLYLDELTSPDELPWQIVGPGGTTVAGGHLNGDEYNPPGGNPRPLHASRSLVLPAGTYELQIGGFDAGSTLGAYEFKVAVASADLAFDELHFGEFPATSHAEVLAFQGTTGDRMVLTVDPWGTAPEATRIADRVQTPPCPPDLEDGYKAISSALKTLDLRENAAKLFILVTDDQRSDHDADSTYNRLLVDLDAIDGTLHTVLNWPMRVDDPANPLQYDATDVSWDSIFSLKYPARAAFPHGMPALGFAPAGTAYVATPNGEYETYLADGVRTAVDMIDPGFAQQTCDLNGFGDVQAMILVMDLYNAYFAEMWNEYGELGYETTGGVWDLNELREAPNPQTGIDPAASFAAAFTEFLKRDIEEELAIDVVASSPDVAFDVLSGHYSNGVMTYEVQFTGDGHAHGFDLQFVSSESGILFGSLPVVILTDYHYDVEAHDADGDELVYTLTDHPAGATIDPETGLITWDPEAEGITEGDHSFTVEVTDGRDGEDTQSWTVTVTDTNEGNQQPQVDPIDPVTIAADLPVEVQVYASDPDDDILTYQLVDDLLGGRPVPGGMRIDHLGGEITWTPDEFDIREAPHEVEVRISDGHGGVATTLLSVTVVELNEERNLRPEIVSVPPDTVPALGFFEYQVRAIDPNGDPLEYQVLHKPAGMTWVVDTHTLYWQPEDAEVGGHFVMIQVSDGRGGMALDSFPLAVTPTNLPPEIISHPADAGPAIVNREWRYEVIAVDPNGDALTYFIDAHAREFGAFIDPVTGVLTWTFDDGDVGKTFGLDILVADGRGGGDVQRVMIPVNPEPPPNEAPLFISQPVKAATPHEEYRYVIRIFDQPTDGPNVLTLGLDGESRKLGMSLREAALPYRPEEPGVYETVLTWTPKEEGTFEVVLTAYDEHGVQAVQRFPITVSQPHPPQFTTTPDTNAYFSVEWVYAVGVTDQDGDDVTLSLGAGAPEDMYFDPLIPYLLRWTPPPGSASSASVTIVATDSRGDRATQPFTLTVQDQGTLNLPPQVISQPFGPAIVGQEWTYLVEARDPEGAAPVRFGFINAPDKNLGMSIEPAGSADGVYKAFVRWTPTVEGNYWVQIEAVEDIGGIEPLSSHGFVLPVTNPNLPPQNIGIPYSDAGNTIYAGYSWRYQIKAVDPDRDFLTQTVSLTNITPGGVSTYYRMEPNNVFAWTPTPDDVGAWKLKVDLADGNGGEYSEEIMLNVVLPTPNANNGPRVVTFPSAPPIAGERWSYHMKALVANPVDGVTFEAGSGNPDGLAVMSDGRVLWQVPLDAAGESFTLNVDVINGALETQYILPLRVVVDNQWPEIAADQEAPSPAYYSEEGEEWTFEVRATDADVGDVLWYELDQASFDAGIYFTHGGKRSENNGELTWDSPHTDDPNDFGRPVLVTVTDEDPNADSAISRRVDGYAQYAFTVLVSSPVPPDTGVQFGSTPETTVLVGDAYEYEIELDYVPQNYWDNHALHLEDAPTGMELDGTYLTWNPADIGNDDVELVVRESAEPYTEVVRQTFRIAAIEPYKLNEPPKILTERLPVPALRDVEYAARVKAFDANRDALTFTLDSASLERKMKIDPKTGVIRWTPTDSGALPIDVTVADEEFSDTKRFWLTVLHNAPPVIDSSPVTEVHIGAGYLYTIEADDPNAGDQLTYEVTEKPAWMGFDPVTHQLIGVPASVDRGRHTVTVVVRDQDDATDQQTFEVQAYDPSVNDPPVIHNEMRASAPIDYCYTHQILATDPDGDLLTYELVSGASGMNLNWATGLFTWTPGTEDITEPESPHEIEILVVDSRGAETPREYHLHVTATLVNSAPVFDELPVPRRGAILNHAYVYEPSATDADNDPLRFVLTSPLAADMDFDWVTGRLEWTPTKTSDLGEHQVSIAAVDLYEAYDIRTWTITVRSANQSPEITSRPPKLVAHNADYQYVVLAEDAEDSPLTYEVTAGPAGMQFAEDGNTLVWPPETGQTHPVGRHSVAVEVTDELGATDTQAWTLVVYDPDVNGPPVFDTTPVDWAIADDGDPQVYTYAPLATDPDGQSVAYRVLGRPAEATWDADTNPSAPIFTWTPLEADVGVHTITFSASDGMLTQTQTLKLWVRTNAGPSIADIPNASMTAGQLFQYTVTATDADDDPLTFSLDTPTIDVEDISIDADGVITWQIATGADDEGAHVVTVTVDDGYGKTDTANFQITVLLDADDPTVTLFASPNPAQVDREVRISVDASDNVGIAETTLTLLTFYAAGYPGTPIELNEVVPINNAGTACYTPEQAGIYNFEATVTDVNENTSVSDVYSVTAVDNLAGPTLILIVPDQGAEITAPTQIIGTIDGGGDGISEWTLTAEWADNPGEPIDIAQGAGEYANAPLGLFDTTFLSNGLYTLTLSATDAAATPFSSSVTREVEVRGQLKMGNFSFSVTDLTINTPGIPISVSRTYDTLNASQDLDFGYGWEWDVGNPKLEIVHPDEQVTFLLTNRIPFRDGTRVVITLPDGTEEGFTFGTQQISNNGLGLTYANRYQPYFRPDPGVSNYLALKDEITLNKHLDEYVVEGGSSEYAFNPAEPFTQNDFVLYTQQGIQYGIDPSGSGRTWIEDKKGNKVEYIPQTTQTLIRHSNPNAAGGESRTVTVRHPSGRITEIEDPVGNSVVYSYNAAGELVSVTNRMNETTTYEYAGPGDSWYDAEVHAHYLKTVIDPLGRRLAAAEYRGDGRLDNTEDAAGNPTEFSYAVADRSETFTSTGVTPTSVTADDHGNVIREEGPNGLILRKYDSHNQLIEETRVVREIDSAENQETDDLTTEYFYKHGLPTGQTDVRDNIATMDYFEGDLISSTNVLNVSTVNTYDDYGNPISTTTAGVTTTLEYDAWGNVTKVTNNDGQILVENSYNGYGLLVRSVDANGRVTEFGYDDLGNQEDSWYVAQDVTFTTQTDYDAEGRVTDTYQKVQRDGESEKNISSSHTEYNAAGQVFRTLRCTYQEDGTMERELITENRYDARGLVVETRSQGLATGSSTPVWFVQQTVYDAQGRALYSTDRFQEGTLPSEIGGAHNTYNADGQVTATRRFLGLSVSVEPTLTGVEDANQVYQSTLVESEESLVDPNNPKLLWSTSTTYEDNRVSETVERYERVTQYTYDDFGQTIQVRRQSADEEGATVWLLTRTVYDKFGRAEYTTDQYVEGTTDAVYGAHTVYGTQGRVIQSRRLEGLVIDLDGATTEVASEGRIVSRTATRYDEGRVIQSTAADGQITSYEYDDLGRRIAVVGHAVPAGSVGLILPGDPLVRHRTETVYDAEGRVERQIGNIRQLADGSLDRSAQQVTAYEYDARGNVVRTTQTAAGSPLEVVTQSEYDDSGRLVAEIDALGNRTDYVHDSEGRLIAVVLPAVPHPTLMDGSEPLMVRPRYEYTYDAQGNQTTIRDNVCQTAGGVFYDHDGAAGDFSEDYDTRVTQFTYDAHGRQTSRSLPLGVESAEVGDFTESFQYDDLGRQTLHVSFEGAVTQSVYDDTAAGAGRLVEKRFFTSETDYADGSGTPDEVWLFTTDALGRQTRVERNTLESGTVVTDYTYDARGRLAGTASPEGTIFYEYDDLGRKTRTYTGHPADVENDWRYTYGALGRLAEVTTLTRDGSPVDINTVMAGDQPEATQYHYELAGNLDWERHANALVTDYEYDGLNRLDKLTHLWRIFPANPPPLVVEIVVAEYDYELLADGSRASVTESYPGIYGGTGYNQINTFDWTYDALGRLVDEVFATDADDGDYDAVPLALLDMDVPESSRLQRDYADHYVFDLVGNRLEKTTDLGLDAIIDEIVKYRYDANDRLTGEDLDSDADTVIDRVTTYGYDVTQQTSKEVEVVDGGVLSSRTTMTYDLQGRMASNTTEAYQADQTVSRRDATTFDYDHTGIRVGAQNTVEMLDDFDNLVVVRDHVTDYLVDHHNFTGYQQVLVETTTDGQTGGQVRKVVYTLGHDVIGQWSQGVIGPAGWEGSIDFPEGSHLFLYDGHGSTRHLAFAAGPTEPVPVAADFVAQHFAYDAYGVPLGFDPILSATTHLYSGEQFDQRIAMQYLRARYYDAASGRFNRLDPFFGNLDDPQSLHKYAYAHGMPTMLVDPSGLFSAVQTATATTIGMRIAFSIAIPVLAYRAYVDSTSGPLAKAQLQRVANQLNTRVTTEDDWEEEEGYIYFAHGSSSSTWPGDVLGIDPTRLSRKDLDFGLGFYTFEADERGILAASRWAKRKARGGGLCIAWLPLRSDRADAAEYV